MTLSSTSDSRKIKKVISLIIREFDFHLCCEINKTKKHKDSFVVKNWVIDDEDFYVAHLMFKRKKTNWETLMGLVPLLGEAWIHYDFFGNGQSRETDYMSRMEKLHYHWKVGLEHLQRDNIELDQTECYKYMLEQTTEWR